MTYIKRIRSLYEIISNRLPSHIYKPPLYIHENPEILCKKAEITKPLERFIVHNNRRKRKDIATIDEVIGLASYENKEDKSSWIIHVSETICENKPSLVLLHELGHFYYLEKLGYFKGYLDENKADQFSYRWHHIMKKEGVLKDKD